jgi:hypothetical protein
MRKEMKLRWGLKFAIVKNIEKLFLTDIIRINENNNNNKIVRNKIENKYPKIMYDFVYSFSKQLKRRRKQKQKLRTMAIYEIITRVDC